MPPPNRLKVAFLIRSLEVGGAERQLCALAAGLDKSAFEVTVLTMYAGGALAEDLASIPGVEVVALDKNGRWDLLGFIARLVRELRRIRPHILHGYMGGANELALAFGRLMGARTVWGIRVSNLEPTHYVWSVGTLFRLSARLSANVDLIIANSEAGRAFHIRHGYEANRIVVIPNGIDAVHFRPDPSAGRGWRDAHGFPSSIRLVGYPARLDPMKDHATFLRAAASVCALRTDTHFICLGDGPRDYQARLEALAHELGIAGQVHWLPAQKDPRPFYNAVDVVTLASAFGEGFPNVIGEAMACGTPCTATAVGDAAKVIGSTTNIVPPGDHEALAEAWGRLLSLPDDQREYLGRQGREWVAAEFSPQALVLRTAHALRALVFNPGP